MVFLDDTQNTVVTTQTPTTTGDNSTTPTDKPDTKGASGVSVMNAPLTNAFAIALSIAALIGVSL
jgi:hypothetical protein